MTKRDLIKVACEQLEKLWKTIDTMMEDEQVTIFNFGGNFNKKAAH